MSDLGIGFALVCATLMIGLGYAWWKYLKKMKRIRAAVGAVLGETPQYMETIHDLDRYARALMGELNQDSITFTVARDQKGVAVA